ncbi:thiolase family protein [Bacillus sp. FJAT-45350]|uniref:thiolase family protein n=1 Tax=Bacillus sp. FJAT-45350 TaxID=2011014 RepID=UPI000BB8D094|nr:thiolase family protein [Bacillus sp. FJAT-45350]
MREAVIVEAVRTPIGKRKGLLQHIRPDDLAAIVLKEVVERANISASLVEDVIMGCVTQSGEQAGDIGRVAALIAGFPDTVPGTTLDRQCGSGQQAIHFAAQAILSGDMDIVIAAGIENMSRVPMGSNYQEAAVSEKLKSQYEVIHQGLSAERITEKWELTREELDQFSFESHMKAIQAQQQGRFEREIVPVEVTLPDGSTTTLREDEGPRSDTSLEVLNSLRPSFDKNGSIHAGNSSQISDGAGAVLIMSKEKAEELGLKPRFTIKTRVVVGSDPTLMLTAPIPATAKVLEKSGLSIDDIDVFEVNEAFSCVPLAWLKETGADRSKLNPNGGAIALGHPLGASGVRLMITMMHELERTNGRFGLQTMCEGHGMANATIIERIN